MRVTKYRTLKSKDTMTPQLVKEMCVNYSKYEKLNQPSFIVKCLNDLFYLDQLTEENVLLLAFDIRMKLIGIMTVSQGTASSTMFPVREILMKSLLMNAVNIVLVHNHPSGDVEPSNDDLASTKRIAVASNIIGINVLDHIIIGDDKFYSFKESKNFFENIENNY